MRRWRTVDRKDTNKTHNGAEQMVLENSAGNAGNDEIVQKRADGAK